MLFYFYTVFKVNRILVRIISCYRLDLRSLSLMRIALSLLIIADLIIRFGDLEAHYTDNGILPTHLLKNFGWQEGYWSLHILNGGTAYTTFIFILHFIAVCFMLIGYKTRITTLLVWVFTVSLHNRNLFVLQSGDDLLRLTLFWAIFIPWGEYYSIDSRRNTKPKPIYLFNFATVGYLLLIASVYTFTVFFKNSNEWRSDYTAIYYALSLDQIRLPIGDWLYGHPTLMKILTASTLWIEILIPLLILIPLRKNITYTLCFILLLILHISIGLTMYVGLFFIINMTTGIGLIPGKYISKFNFLQTSSYNGRYHSNYKSIQWLNHSFLAFVISICLLLNLSYMNWFGYELNPGIKSVVNVLRLNQYWGMFSPHIMKEDGWYIYEGFTENGRHWDLKYNDSVIHVDKPEHVVKDYKTDRWRKLAENIQRNEYTFLRPLYCKYYLRNWNKHHPENPMASLNLLFMEEVSLPDYQYPTLERKQFCFCINN